MTDLFDNPTLVVLCKRPALHQGKQRLAQTLGPAPALRVAQALLACALEDARQWPGPVVISPARAEDRSWAGALLAGARSLPQDEGNLGQRIQAVDRTLRADGARRILYMGTDAPALTPAHYRAARHGFDRADVVLSAASDGGVTLMGSAAPWPDLTSLPWSEETLGERLAALCRDRGLRVEYVPPAYDIDVEIDLRRLRSDLLNDPRPARRRLRRLIETLGAAPRQDTA